MKTVAAAGPTRSPGSDRPRLNRVDWVGSGTFRCLSYYFSVRWNWDAFGDQVRHILAPFAVPVDPDEERSPHLSGIPPTYSLVRFGRSAKRRYRLVCNDDYICKERDPAVAVSNLFWHVNTECTMRTGDFFLIHAGAVQTPLGPGLVLPGASGSGKSTLVAGLVRAGFGYLSDEAAAIDPVSRNLYPYPRALSLKGAHLLESFPEIKSASRMAVSGTGRFDLHATDISGGSVGRPCPVGFVIVPRYESGAPTELVPISRAAAVLELGSSSMGLRHYRERALPLLADLATGAACYRLRSGRLADAVRAVEEAVHAAPEPLGTGRGALLSVGSTA